MIAPAKEGYSLVIMGAWNPRIFSPPWAKQWLAPEADIGVSIAVGNPSLPLRLEFRGLQLTVMSSRLVLQTAQLDDGSLQSAQECAIRILDLLPHTPLRAVGINVQFLDNEPSPDLLRLFDLRDGESLAETEGTVQTTSIRRSVLLRGELLLNLTLELRLNGQVAFDFNFHQDATTTDAAKAHLNRGFVALRNEALRILDAAYALAPVHT